MNELDRAILEVGGVGKLAAAIGVVQSAVSNWKVRGGHVPVEHCANIEKATAGAVTRKDLRPNDFWRIWPDLAHLAPSTEGQV